MNFSKRVLRNVCGMNANSKLQNAYVCVKRGKRWSPSIRSELLISYTEFTINLEKFISVAGSLYL